MCLSPRPCVLSALKSGLVAGREGHLLHKGVRRLVHTYVPAWPHYHRAHHPPPARRLSSTVIETLTATEHGVTVWRWDRLQADGAGMGATGGGARRRGDLGRGTCRSFPRGVAGPAPPAPSLIPSSYPLIASTCSAVDPPTSFASLSLKRRRGSYPSSQRDLTLVDPECTWGAHTQVNGPNQKALLSRLRVTGYPTLLLLRDGKTYDFTGQVPRPPFRRLREPVLLTPALT